MPKEVPAKPAFGGKSKPKAPQEKKRQFLSSLSGGIVIPELLVEKEFRKENQSKTIQYIDLEKYHSKNKPSQENIKELYERNKSVFFTELKSIRFAEIKPELISGSQDYNENFFKQLDLSLIHISEPTRLLSIAVAVLCV